MLTLRATKGSLHRIALGESAVYSARSDTPKAYHLACFGAMVITSGIFTRVASDEIWKHLANPRSRFIAPIDKNPEPRWPAALAIFAAGFLPFALPRSLSLAPPWALTPANVVLLAAAILAHRHGRHKLNAALSYANLGLLTLEMLYSLVTLVLALPTRTLVARELLESAAIIWVANVIVFAAWYWRLDAGGPHVRDQHNAHSRGAFLFPQMAVMEPGANGLSVAEAEGWRPGFIDYLALSFYTCTAFSPTDVPVLSRWAKLMMMVQAMISFGTVLILAARAVNIF